MVFGLVLRSESRGLLVVYSGWLKIIDSIWIFNLSHVQENIALYLEVSYRATKAAFINPSSVFYIATWFSKNSMQSMALIFQNDVQVFLTNNSDFCRYSLLRLHYDTHYIPIYTLGYSKISGNNSLVESVWWSCWPTFLNHIFQSINLETAYPKENGWRV